MQDAALGLGGNHRLEIVGAVMTVACARRTGRQVAVDGFHSHLRHQLDAPALRDQARYRGVFITEIAEVARTGRTGDNASRYARTLVDGIVVNPINAQRAFLHHPRIEVVFARAIGTRPGAEFAADAQILIDENDAVLGPFE